MKQCLSASGGKQLVLATIRLYQKTLSLDHGPLKFLRPNGQCKFRPTCSEYTHEALEKYGVSQGLLKGLKRLMKCHPWSLGGYDPLK